MGKLSARVRSSGALYDARSGGRIGRPFGSTPARATNNRMGTDIESVRELDRELIARGVRHRVERRDESLDTQWRDERVIRRNADRVRAARLGETFVTIGGDVHRVRGMFESDVPDAVALEIARRLRDGKIRQADGSLADVSQVVTDGQAERSRNMIVDPRATEAPSAELRALARRFRKLEATRGREAAERMLRAIVCAA